jgi:hypothetical protein
VLGGISSGLGTLRDFLDKAGDTRLQRPPGILGLGEMMVGTAPEELQAQAAGFSPFSEEPNYGNILDPRIKPGREQGVLDVASLGLEATAPGLAGLRNIGMRAKVNPVGRIIDTAPARSDGLDAVVGRGRLPLIHGSNNSALTLEDIDILRTGQRQSKRSTPVGGFYMSSPEDLAHAEGYAKMRSRGAPPDAPVDPTIYDMGVRQGTKVLRINGSTDRLSQDYIKELQSQGYGLVVGKDVRGRTEYVAIDKDALEAMNPRKTESNAPADMSRREFLANTGKVAAGAAAASAVPGVLRGADNVAPRAASKADDVPAKATRRATATEYHKALLDAEDKATRAVTPPTKEQLENGSYSFIEYSQKRNAAKKEAREKLRADPIYAEHKDKMTYWEAINTPGGMEYLRKQQELGNILPNEYSTGGSVTMPNNYRAGGRVRMI